MIPPLLKGSIFYTPYHQFIQPDKLHLPVTGPYIFVTFLKKNLTLNFQAPRTYLIVKVRLLLVRLARFELASFSPADFKSDSCTIRISPHINGAFFEQEKLTKNLSVYTDLALLTLLSQPSQRPIGLFHG